MMRAVWSFWTKPYRAYYKGNWASEKHHLLAWVLSVETARRHYPITTLITDDDGARLLVDDIGLNFTCVSTQLNELPNVEQEWFNLGKLYAYRAQTAPFVHIDNDVFLWKPLPSWTESVPVFAQNPERLSLDGASVYRPEACAAAIRSEGWLPEEWAWYLAAGGDEAVNCGVLGGSDVSFLAYYADMAINAIEHPRNHAPWARLDAKVADGILVEQYFLSACLSYHRERVDSPYKNIRIQYLFDSFASAFDEAQAAILGYTHLIGGAKRNRRLTERLETRVRQDYRDHYKRCLKYLQGRT
jgi:hypothetical protein